MRLPSLEFSNGREVHHHHQEEHLQRRVELAKRVGQLNHSAKLADAGYPGVNLPGDYSLFKSTSRAIGRLGYPGRRDL